MGSPSDKGEELRELWSIQGWQTAAKSSPPCFCRLSFSGSCVHLHTYLYDLVCTVADLRTSTSCPLQKCLPTLVCSGDKTSCTREMALLEFLVTR